MRGQRKPLGEREWLPSDPHDACKETIKARERSITDLRYRVRELERDATAHEDTLEQMREQHTEDLAERARQIAEKERDEREATVNILRNQKRILAEENRGLRRSLQGRCHWRPKSDTATLHGVKYFWCVRHEIWHRIGAEV